mgnify:CR=1 FL=1
MSEHKRGCGFRKIGALYLVSDPGPAWICDALPLPLEACGCCGYKPPFNRNLEWLTADYLEHLSTMKHDDKKCEACPETCPVCWPYGPGYYEKPLDKAASEIRYGLMFVSSQKYTPETFVKEVIKQGISKRIPEVPKGLILGKTWVLLASQKVPRNFKVAQNGLAAEEPTEFMEAIFYGFIPQRVEMPYWKGAMSKEQLDLLQAQGVTPVPIEPTATNRKKHQVANINLENRKKRLGI